MRAVTNDACMVVIVVESYSETDDYLITKWTYLLAEFKDFCNTHAVFFIQNKVNNEPIAFLNFHP